MRSTVCHNSDAQPAQLLLKDVAAVLAGGQEHHPVAGHCEGGRSAAVIRSAG
jgi:hypothetical protein